MQVMVVDDDSDKPKAIGSITKKPRAAKTKVDPSKSIALKNMLNWIRDELNDVTGRIIPTIIEFHGCQTNPWELDYQENKVFLWIAQIVETPGCAL
jgi:hypothetical protein